jgi:hypothetical protein
MTSAVSDAILFSSLKDSQLASLQSPANQDSGELEQIIWTIDQEEIMRQCRQGHFSGPVQE